MSEQQGVDPSQVLPKFTSNLAPASTTNSAETVPAPEPISPPPMHTRNWLKIILSIVGGVVGVAVIATAIIGYLIVLRGKTVFGYSMPDKIWHKLITDTSEVLAERTIGITYADHGTFKFVPSKFVSAFGQEVPAEQKAAMDVYGFTMKDLGLKETISGFVNDTDSAHPKVDVHLDTALTNSGSTYSASFDGKIIDVVGYFRYDFNSSVSLLLKKLDAADPSIKVQIDKYKNTWLKINNINENSTGLNTTSLGQVSKDTPSPAVERELQDIYLKNRFFDIKSFKGIEKLDGVYCMHYELSVDTAKIRTILYETAKTESRANSIGDNQDFLDFYGKLLDSFIHKWQVQNFEVWVGIADKQVYKTTTTTNMISAAGMLNTLYDQITKGGLKETFLGSLGGARESARDAKRIADMRQVATMLEVFYNDHGGYPDGQNGLPVNMNQYLPQFPQAPTPSDGVCNDYYNTYWYAPAGAPTPPLSADGGITTVYPRYTLTFCVGGQVGGYGPGILELSPSGIATPSPCPAPGKCASVSAYPVEPNGGAPFQPSVSQQDIQDYENEILTTVLDVFDQMPLDATITIETSAKNFGKDKTIEEPSNAVDIEKEIKKNSSGGGNPLFDPPPANAT